MSSYKERNEILTNTGVMSLTREWIKDYGLCILPYEMPILEDKYTINWYIDRISQKHGILKPYNSKNVNTAW